MNSSKKKLTILSLLLGALPLLLAGIDGISFSNPFGPVYLVAGLAYLVFSFLTEKIKTLWVNLFGSLVLIVVVFDMIAQGKEYLPYAYAVAAIMNILVVFLFKKKSAEN